MRRVLAELIALRTSSSSRISSNLCAVNGWKTLHDVVRMGARVERVYAAGGEWGGSKSPTSTTTTDLPVPITVTSDWIAKAGGIERAAHDAAIGVVTLPPLHTPESVARSRLLILDGISDPSNVGALLRSAAALKWSILLSSTCADATNSKALQAGSGAQWSTPHARLKMGDIVSSVRAARAEAAGPTACAKKGSIRLTVLGDPRAEDEISEIALLLSSLRSRGCLVSLAVVLGNEAHGFDAKWYEDEEKYGGSSILKAWAAALTDPCATPAACITVRARIGPRNAFESMNVAAAGAVIMHTLGNAMKRKPSSA